MNEAVRKVHEMIEQYANSVGLDKAQVFDVSKNLWHWRVGSANIQVIVEGVAVGKDRMRHYLRIFSPLLEIPTVNETAFYRHLLELNDSKLGVKLTVTGNWAYATYERDIQGMDYQELSTCIGDLEWWADLLDDQLKNKFHIV
jgi:hypothetical protein